MGNCCFDRGHTFVTMKAKTSEKTKKKELLYFARQVAW